MLEMDLKIFTLNTVLTCFLMQTTKHSITIDKVIKFKFKFQSNKHILIPLKGQGFSPPTSFACWDRLPVFLHAISSDHLTFRSTFPSLQLFFSMLLTKFPHFLKETPHFLQPLHPALLYIVVCSFKHPPYRPHHPDPHAAPNSPPHRPLLTSPQARTTFHRTPVTVKPLAIYWRKYFTPVLQTAR